MAGRRMFEGRLHVHYGQAYVRAAPIDDSWEEIVEASLAAVTSEAALVEWGEADGTRLTGPPGSDPGGLGRPGRPGAAAGPCWLGFGRGHQGARERLLLSR